MLNKKLEENYGRSCQLSVPVILLKLALLHIKKKLLESGGYVYLHVSKLLPGSIDQSHSGL